jgi:hypothetical protein
MKNKLFILAILSLFFSAQLSAQTTKKKKVVKKATTTQTIAKKTVTPAAPVAETKQVPAAPAPATPVAKTKAKKASVNDYYTNAVGLKALYGVAVTGKHFFDDRQAVEVIAGFRSFYDSREVNVTALYQYHTEIPVLEGLRWYIGGGGTALFYSYNNYYNGNTSVNSVFGVAGVGGVEYKFKNIPLAVSVDWLPTYILNGNSGFVPDSGGAGVKYTF